MNESVTPFGLFTKKLCKMNGQRSKDMARILDITPSYLSAIECGKRNIPSGFLPRLIEHYDLNAADIQRLKHAVLETDLLFHDRLDISHLSLDDRQLVGALLHKWHELSQRDRSSLRSIVAASQS